MVSLKKSKDARICLGRWLFVTGDRRVVPVLLMVVTRATSPRKLRLLKAVFLSSFYTVLCFFFRLPFFLPSFLPFLLIFCLFVWLFGCLFFLCSFLCFSFPSIVPPPSLSLSLSLSLSHTHTHTHTHSLTHSLSLSLSFFLSSFLPFLCFRVLKRFLCARISLFI